MRAAGPHSPQVLIAELLPPRDRARLIGWLMALPFGFSFVMASVFPLVVSVGLERVAFAAYGAFAAACFAVLFVFLPETRGAAVLSAEQEAPGRNAEDTFLHRHSMFACLCWRWLGS